jgi:hypothetical protein
MTFLLGLLSRFKPPTWLLFCLAFLLALAVCCFAWYRYGREIQRAEDQAAASQIEAAQQQEIDALQAKAEAILAKRVEQDSKADAVSQQLREEIPHVVTKIVHIPAPVACASAPTADTESRPAIDGEFKRGFVRVWNRTLDPTAAGVPADPGSAAGAAARAGLAESPDDQQFSDVDQRDVLDNHAENASRFDQCRRDFNALIDAVNALNAVNP